jgi:hypothetical protein
MKSNYLIRSRTSDIQAQLGRNKTGEIVFSFLYEIRGFHGGDYEEFRLLRCDSVLLL